MARNRTYDRLHPGALLATTFRAGDDLSVRLRLSRRSDAPAVRRFLEGLDLESRRLRFFSPMPVVRGATVRHFTAHDPRRRTCLVATAPRGGTEEVLGLADASISAARTAEIAIVVADEVRGRGIGSLLVGALAALAARQGATRLKAEMLPHNEPMVALMRGIGPTVLAFEEGNAVAYTRLEPEPLGRGVPPRRAGRRLREHGTPRRAQPSGRSQRAISAPMRSP